MSLLVTLALAAVTASPAPDPALLAEYRERRARLRERLGEEVVAVVLSARDAEPYRQSPDFFYLTGLAETAGAALVLLPGKEDTETLYLPPRDRAEERWIGEALDPGDIDLASGEPDAARAAAMKATGVAAVKSLTAFDNDLGRQIDRGRALAIAAASVERGRPLTPELELARDLRDRHPGMTVRALGKEIAKLRSIKSERELESMARAVAITLEAQRRVAGAVKPGQREYEVRALLEWVFATRGAERPAFPSIVGSGPNSTVLHYRSGAREMREGDLVVVDIGAEWQGYAADVTRTFPVSGRFTKEQRTVYDTVVRAQEAALARVKPGARLRSDVHAAAKQVIEEAGHGKFFPHGTSHYVGLDVHDVGERDGVLEPGMVITVEPGIYLPAQSLGVRIEDMVLVTMDGYRHLTSTLPRTAGEIEALMAKGRAAAPGPGPEPVARTAPDAAQRP